jgi:OOP family OmpA-OmpF porin
LRSKTTWLAVVATLLAVHAIGCGGSKNRVCSPEPSFSSPAYECVALAEPPPPPPPPEPEPPKPEPEPVKPEPEPEPPKPEPEPEPPPAVVVKQETIELDRTVQFEVGSAKLVEDSKNLLDEVAAVLQAHAEIKKVQVEGHTDSKQSTRKNKKLSDLRAKAVRTYLIGKGVAKGRLVAKGFGEAKPVADNETEEGRFKNRRVDLRILKRDESAGQNGGGGGEKTDLPDDVADDAAKKPDKKKKKKKKKASAFDE